MRNVEYFPISKSTHWQKILENLEDWVDISLEKGELQQAVIAGCLIDIIKSDNVDWGVYVEILKEWDNA